jgi:glycosyltransferase involved in cell wall biosynthesis
VHAHFAFITADIAKQLSGLLDINFSVTAHAQDIYTSPDRIKQFSNDALFLVTCTEYNRKYINEITDFKFQDRIYKVYHGLDASKWENNYVFRKLGGSIINIICVARLVEKKGIIYLLRAIKILVESGIDIKCTIVGEGPLKTQFDKYIKESGISKYVQILGFMHQDNVKEYICRSDMFVLPCIVADNGDMDGLPNVILEAMALNIPVISTSISAIPEVIDDRFNGLLVKEKDEEAIANAIMELVKDEKLYERIKNNSRTKLLDEFDIGECTSKLIDIFRNNICC